MAQKQFQNALRETGFILVATTWTKVAWWRELLDYLKGLSQLLLLGAPSYPKYKKKVLSRTKSFYLSNDKLRRCSH